jgi:hypothetical protein
MACRLTSPSAAPVLAALLATLFLAGAVPLAAAQGVPDPTRPSGVAEYGVNGGSDSGLQSIIRRHGQKPRALINGELVTLGDKVGEARLVAIKDDHVVLQDASGQRETLALTPGINKQARPPHSKPDPSRRP